MTNSPPQQPHPPRQAPPDQAPGPVPPAGTLAGSPRARSFDAAAAQYAAARPTYPPALFDAVEEITGRPLLGARVVDVGAGTGISSGLLAGRGARVTAVEPGAGMAREFRRALPEIPLVRGVGDALPLAGGWADLITYAQSWHWTDPARSLPEAVRVLRPGGSLALWWNAADYSVPWLAAQGARFRQWIPEWTNGSPGAARELPAAFPAVHRTLRWTRSVPLATHLDNIGSHSLLLTLGRDRAAELLDRERAELLKVFPGGTVPEAYTVELTVTTTEAAQRHRIRNP
ncbi:class I SAM-dependent methyltransferase [Streptomyces tsukubensis]|uniref:class I SAM-dependent methyltransferase n=1 Tax=Streptomyces tsukubensis TaxID=83656 RepID=UPI0036C6F5EE